MISTVVFPKEYFISQIYFAFKVTKITNKPIETCYIQYTDLYKAITNIRWNENDVSPIWQKLIFAISNEVDELIITDIIYDAYTSFPHSNYDPNYVPKDMNVFGSLVLSYDEYNKNKETIGIHFIPKRDELSPLAAERFDELHENFRQLLIFAKNNYDMKYLSSSSWLNNIINFRKLFPQDFLDKLKDLGMGSYTDVWQQFIKPDGNGDLESLQVFLQNLGEAQNIDEANMSIPLKVLEGVGEIKEFYKMYMI